MYSALIDVLLESGHVDNLMIVDELCLIAGALPISRAALTQQYGPRPY